MLTFVPQAKAMTVQATTDTMRARLGSRGRNMMNRLGAYASADEEAEIANPPLRAQYQRGLSGSIASDDECAQRGFPRIAREDRREMSKLQ